MTRAILLLAALALTACPPPAPPAPIPPDASDASTAPVDDAGPTLDAPVWYLPCQAACATLARLCGPQPASCSTVWAHIDGANVIRNAKTHTAITCVDVASAGSAAELLAMGVTCGVQP